jgi:hypothetical protein
MNEAKQLSNRRKVVGIQGSERSKLSLFESLPFFFLLDEQPH